MSQNSDRVAAPTPETPSHPVGRINGAQTMSFTPVPDHPTPETPSHALILEWRRLAAGLDAEALTLKWKDQSAYSGGKARALQHCADELEKSLAGAVSHPQPEGKTTNDDEVARGDGRGLSAGFGTAGSDAGAQGNRAETK